MTRLKEFTHKRKSKKKETRSHNQDCISIGTKWIMAKGAEKIGALESLDSLLEF